MLQSYYELVLYEMKVRLGAIKVNIKDFGILYMYVY